ncbi:MAG TPA: prepilin-type N-terminal cleavage/methylation domain-containing protein [Solirubrobacterales bacterium]|nr:prepilin-type N-terminal cleavage/methylation domain-containing protein [Solirubrobacterales bacterium]
MKRWSPNLLRHEDGFTIIEALVAAFILTLGSLAVFMTFLAAIHGVQRSKESQFGIAVAQREMEWVRAHSFATVGTTGTRPAAEPTNAKSPLYRVSSGGSKFLVKRSEAGSPSPVARNEMRFVDEISGGFPVSKEVKFVEGTKSDKQVQATVYRFVLCEEELPPAECQAKRVVIDVVPRLQATEQKYQRNYYELQSTILNPAVVG